MTPESAISIIDDSVPTIANVLVGTGAHERVDKRIVTHISGIGKYEYTLLYDLTNPDCAKLIGFSENTVTENPEVP